MIQTIEYFGGSIPKIAPHLIPNNLSSYALDCRLVNGSLQSFLDVEHTPKEVQKNNKLVLLGCCWLEVPMCADLVLGSCGRVYATGVGDYPQVGEIDDNCEVSWKRLGLPCPTKPPKVHNTNTEKSPEVEASVYAYQYVNSFGNRSALSPPSALTYVKHDQWVEVSGWEKPSDLSWDIVGVRIYRTVTGAKPDNTDTADLTSEYMLVGEVDINADKFIDKSSIDSLTVALVEDIVLPPPVGLQGIKILSQSNTLVGFTGNRLYFTETNEPHNWRHFIDLDDNIQAITVTDGIVYVATDGVPYVVQGDTDCKNAAQRRVLKHQEPKPLVGCGNLRMTSVPNGAAFISELGVVIMFGDKEPFYFTQKLYTTEQYQALNPETLIPTLHQGRLYLFGENGAFVVDAPALGSESLANSHTNLSDKGVISTTVTRDGLMYLVKKDGLYLWEGSTKKRKHKWVSKEYYSGVSQMLGSAKLVSLNGKETIRLYSGKLVVLDKPNVQLTTMYALPLYSFSDLYKIELEGTAEVKVVSLAGSHKDHIGYAGK